MTRFLTAVSVVALLAACDNEQPLVFPDDGTETNLENEGTVTDGDGEPILDEEGEEIEFADNGIPEPIAFNLASADFDAGDETLTVTITSLDSTPLEAVYERNTALDVDGYVAFSQQEDALDRFFVGYGQSSNDGNTTGVLVMDGGQFTRFIAGVYYTQNNYTPHVSSQPDNGLVAYTGRYIGILNFDELDDSQLLTASSGIPANLLAGQPARVLGDVLINADFVDMQVNGGIANRRVASATALDPFTLFDIGLVPADILENGTFFGEANRPDASAVGSYGGTFGGNEASGVAMGVHLTGDFIPEFDSEEEFGLIVLTKCGLAGDGPFCDDAQPDFDP